MPESVSLPLVTVVASSFRDGSPPVEYRGEFPVEDRCFALNFEVRHHGVELTAEIRDIIREFSALIANTVSYSFRGVRIEPIDVRVESGSLVIVVLTIVTTAAGFAAGYKSLREGIPLIVRDVMNVSEKVIRLAIPAPEKSSERTPDLEPALPVPVSEPIPPPVRPRPRGPNVNP